MNTYKILHKQIYRDDVYSIVPIRMEDRYDIMRWRNEQIYHLRQSKPLTEEEQDNYFNTIIQPLFTQDKPEQLLFSFLKGEECMGYGGLVHIDWEKQKAEVSFLIASHLEKDFLQEYMTIFFGFMDEVAFVELGLNKLFTYAYDVRPHIYPIIEACGFIRKEFLPKQIKSGEVYADMVIHEKEPVYPRLRLANISDMETTFKWASDPLVRKFSFNKNRITYPEHQQWFVNKINDKNCEYYIFHNQHQCLGSIRYDIENGDSGRISYLVDPSLFQKGYGKMMFGMGIELLKKRRPEVKQIYGFIEPENIACLKVVEFYGFNRTLEADLYKVTKTF